MAEYESLQQLNELFKAGRVNDLPDEINVSGFPYILKDTKEYPIPQMIRNQLKNFVIYSSSGQARQDPRYQEAVQEGTLNEWIVFIWGIASGLYIAPARVVTNTAARAEADLQTGTKSLSEGQYVTIKDEEEIRFVPFNKSVVGKVDTGANMSSIHAEYWKVIPGSKQIEFYSSLLSNNKIIMMLKDQVVVKTSEGTEYRPVVEFDVEIKGKRIKNAAFNLNDRKGMEHPLLIGQNILEKGNFLVDPTQQKDTIGEDVDWNALQEIYKDVEPVNSTPETIDIYNILLNTDITFQDLVRHIKTLAQESIEKVENY